MQTNELASAAGKGTLPPKAWNELHDYLTLALDALGDRPEDFDRAFLTNCVIHQRLALQITHRAIQGGERSLATETQARFADALSRLDGEELLIIHEALRIERQGEITFDKALERIKAGIAEHRAMEGKA